MTTATIGKWGNASAIRLPKPFCEMLGLGIGDDVTITVEGDRRIVIKPASQRFTIRERMKEWDGVRYKSEEADWGDPVGEELW